MFDIDRTTEETKDYIKICDSGDTHIKGLWIKTNKIKISSFIKAFSGIEEYEEKEII